MLIKDVANEQNDYWLHDYSKIHFFGPPPPREHIRKL